MTNDDLSISRALLTHVFESELYVVGDKKDQRQLEKMQVQAILDAVAEQILQGKHELAKSLGREAFASSIKIFLEELFRSETMQKKAESLRYPSTRKMFTAFVENAFLRFGRFLERSDLECGRGLLSIANRSPFPKEEEQRSFLRRLFGD
jgi:hypothetical protein